MSILRRLCIAAALISGLSISLSPGLVAGNGWKTSRHKEEIRWLSNLDKGLEMARKLEKPVMIDFMAKWCPPCHAMDDSTFSDPAVIRKASSFVTVRIDIDKQREVATKYGALARKYGGIGIPNILFLAPNGKSMKHIVGYYGPKDLVSVMDSVLMMKESNLAGKGEGNKESALSKQQ